jgi:phage/plasmid-like protein (TIGR03299 family)
MTEAGLTTLESRDGTTIKQVQDLDDLITQAGFDFHVEKAALYDPEGNELDNTFLLRRTDTHAPLNVVRGRYQIVSNEEMLRPFHNMVKQFGARYETAGFTNNGRVCWVSAKLPDDLVVRPGDRVENRIVSMIYHDGTRRNSYCPYTNRVFCNNQLNTLNRAAREGYQIGHVGNYEQQLQQAYAQFQQTLEQTQQFNTQATQLAKHKMSVSQARNFLTHVFPFGQESTDRSVTRANNRREQVYKLFREGAGNTGDTRWDMLNAITEWYDHHRKTRGTRQFLSAVTGTGSTPHKRQAFRMLLEADRFSCADPKRA